MPLNGCDDEVVLMDENYNTNKKQTTPKTISPSSSTTTSENDDGDDRSDDSSLINIDTSPPRRLWCCNLCTLLKSCRRTASASVSICCSRSRCRKWELFSRNLANSWVCWTFTSLMISAVPYMAFLLTYGANSRLQVLPTSVDSVVTSSVTSVQNGNLAKCAPGAQLYDIGSLELTILRFRPDRLVASYSSPLLDFLSTAPYLAHYALPVVYPLALIVLADRLDCARMFYQMVGWTMWVLYVLWYLFPTGPPWFYDSVATMHNTHSSGSPNGTSSSSTYQLREGAAFARVDSMTGIKFFHNMFAGNPVPYAAFPSGHVAWPTCMLLTQPWSMCWPFYVYVAVVIWATLYSGHHYLLDAVGAVIVVLIVNRFLNNKQPSTSVASNYDTMTSSAVSCSWSRRLRICHLFKLALFRPSGSPRRKSVSLV